MYRVIAALLFLVASAAAASAQGLSPSVWQSRAGDAAESPERRRCREFQRRLRQQPGWPVSGSPYDLAGRVRGPRVAFQTSRTWTSDCRVNAVWSGRFVNPTTVATQIYRDHRRAEWSRDENARQRGFPADLTRLASRVRASAASEASETRPGTQRKSREAQYCDALRASIPCWVPGLIPLGLKKPSLHSPGREPAYAAFFFAEMS